MKILFRLKKTIFILKYSEPTQAIKLYYIVNSELLQLDQCREHIIENSQQPGRYGMVGEQKITLMTEEMAYAQQLLNNDQQIPANANGANVNNGQQIPANVVNGQFFDL